MAAGGWKIFNDSVHGCIELPPLCVKIIDTPEFQRLRFIKQLGLCYFVYPGASHNRFEHSIGVCYLAGLMAKTLKDKCPAFEISEKEILYVQIAGLCHDLGHGPFSHVFDIFLDDADKGREHQSLKNILSTGCGMKRKFCYQHEIRSFKLLCHMIERYGWEDFERGELKIIKDMITPPENLQRLKKPFLYQIVANRTNGIDVDKWDYFARDCHHLGIKNNFDHLRLMKFARIISVDDTPQICYRDKEIMNLYEMFHTRMNLHRQAIHHHVTHVIHIMLQEALCKSIERQALVDAESNMSEFAKLTDGIFQKLLYSTDVENAQAKEILERICSRNLYRFVAKKLVLELNMKKEPFKTKFLEEMVNLSRGELPEDKLIIDVVTYNYGNDDLDPLDSVHFFSKEEPDRAKKKPKSEVSLLLAEHFQEHEVRLYIRDKDESLEDNARKCFHGAFKRLQQDAGPGLRSADRQF